MPTFRPNTAVDPSQISSAFDGIAAAFKPPSATEIYAGAKAAETRQKVSQIADLYGRGLASTPEAQRLFDQQLAAAGIASPNQTLTAVKMGNDTTLATNAATQARELTQAREHEAGETLRKTMDPVAADASRFNVPRIQDMFHVPAVQTGVVKTAEGSSATLPDGRVIMGPAKALTTDQVDAQTLQEASPAERRAKALGGIPTENIVSAVTGQPVIAYRPDAVGQRPAPAAVGPSNVSRLQAERAALPPGDPRIGELDAAIAAEGRGAQADPYTQKTGEALAKRHEQIVALGDQATGMTQNLDRLDTLLKGIPTGATAQRRVQIAQYAKDLGLDDVANRLTGGKLDEAQGANAIIQKMAPALRIPGSGAQSDRELQNFLQSLPSLQSTPGGNAIILETLRGAAQHQQQAAAIARQAQAGKIDKFEADRQISALPSPFARFTPADPSAPAAPAADPAAPAPGGAPAAPAPGAPAATPAPAPGGDATFVRGPDGKLMRAR